MKIYKDVNFPKSEVGAIDDYTWTLLLHTHTHKINK